MKKSESSNFLKKSKIKISLIFTISSVLILLIIDVSLFILRDFRQSNFHPPKYLMENNINKNVDKIERRLTKDIQRFQEKRTYDRNELIEDFLSTLPFIFLFGIFLFFLTFKLVSRNLRKIEENYQEMENFVHNAGHELKTPLAVISSNLQLAEKIGKIGDFKELNKENLIEVNKANSLIDGLFSLSQISKEDDLKEVDLKNFIEKIISENEKKFSEKNISVKKDLENFNFKISKNHFYILFSNIFFNAIRYSEKNGEIKISLKNNILEISDKGIGISEKNLKKIFDRFFQEGESRESEKGFGIGLSLVKKISDIYGLKISVESVKNVGTKFVVRF